MVEQRAELRATLTVEDRGFGFESGTTQRTGASGPIGGIAAKLVEAETRVVVHPRRRLDVRRAERGPSVVRRWGAACPRRTVPTSTARTSGCMCGTAAVTATSTRGRITRDRRSSRYEAYRGGPLSDRTLIRRWG